MAAYPYRLPRRYRYRPRGRYRSRKGITSGQAAGIALVLLAAGAGSRAVTAHHGGSAPPDAAARSAAASAAISYARAQLGKPYLWGGTGPGAFDCSGLAMMAYRSAGVGIDRTSQDQWATERHVPASRVQAGDLVFFAGSDGTMTSPGHVGIVIGGGKMIEAYATGYPVRAASYNRPDLVGFTDPASLAIVTAAARVPPNEALANQMAAARGWTGAQAACLDELWTEESGFDSTAVNSSSGATGIPQLLPSAHRVPANWSSPRVQIAWGLDYISGTYGTPCAAWAFERSHVPNWY